MTTRSAVRTCGRRSSSNCPTATRRNSLHVYKRRGKSYSFDPVALDPIPFASSHVHLVRDLLDAVQTGRAPLANEAVARNGMEILMGAAQSHLEGDRTMALPLSDRGMCIPGH